MQPLSLSDSEQMTGWLIYIDSIADAYSQYFVNDIEHTE